MGFRDYVLKALCVSLCLASSVVMSSNEENERDFIDHVLRIRNPDKALSSVLGHMERSRQHSISARHLRARLSDNTDCEEPSEILPEYTESIETSRERGLRQLSTQKHYPICRLERRIRKLNTIEYEFRPAYYEEVLCSASTGDNERVASEICSSLGFSCVQWNKTIHLTRRRYSSDCWETRTMVIPAGCECMWPVHRLGDISLHV